MEIQDSPDRYALANELHARPFPSISAPCHVGYLAVKRAEGAARDREADRAHLLDLLARYGVPEPPAGATHYFGRIGKDLLKWESHTEFVTYTLFRGGAEGRAFDGSAFEGFPSDWLAAMPGARLTSAQIHVEMLEDEAALPEKLSQWFVGESTAANWVSDKAAIVAGDFHIDPQGHMRFAVFVRPQTGPGRVGRMIQRLSEIETYKSMALLGLPVARDCAQQINHSEQELSGLIETMRGAETGHEQTLQRLLGIAADLAALSARVSFRFGATGAYENIVHDRIAVMRSHRFKGYQTFAEFMNRRFDPGMRTVASAQTRLASMSEQVTQAANLLRTRVDVERSAVNQALLESLDRRADLQLHLQRTVEGLSVVAISYYAVNLMLYILAPMAKAVDITKLELGAMVTPIVVVLVWLGIRRIHKRMQ
ncbi:MAG: DUF3422 domain-containing protein [Mangrovicoccus sp.]|nr:DUF3422 domain-containing protein [Mangrovicoccus sp.]